MNGATVERYMAKSGIFFQNLINSFVNIKLSKKMACTYALQFFKVSFPIGD
jgi:hypothetical protein